MVRPVFRVAPLSEAVPMELSAPSSPAEDLVFPFDAEGSQRTPLPYEQSAAAAFESIRQLDAILEPTGDAQMTVSGNWAAAWRCKCCGRGWRGWWDAIGPGGCCKQCSKAATNAWTARSARRRWPGAAACRRRLTPHALTSPPPPPFRPQLARHVELACGGAHRVDPAALATVLQRLGYCAKLHDSVRLAAAAGCCSCCRWLLWHAPATAAL